MDLTKDYYKILDIPSNATPEEIKGAFRKLAKEYHPDLHVNNPLQKLANEKFKEINEANDILSDEAKRKDYDYLRSNQTKNATGHNTNSNNNTYSGKAQTRKNNEKDSQKAKYENNKTNEKNRGYRNSNQSTASDYSKNASNSYQYNEKGKNICYIHNQDSVTKCVICDANLCIECAEAFDKPICINCLKKNNNAYLKYLEKPLIITIITIIFGIIVGMLVGKKVDFINNNRYHGAIILSIYMTGSWLYLTYIGEGVKKFIYKLLYLTSHIFDITEATAHVFIILSNIIIALTIGVIFGITYGVYKFVDNIQRYFKYKEEYNRTNEFIKQNFGI